MDFTRRNPGGSYSDWQGTSKKDPDDIPRDPLPTGPGPSDGPNNGPLGPNTTVTLADQSAYSDALREGGRATMSDVNKWFADNGYDYLIGPVIRGNGQIYTSHGTFRMGPDGLPTGEPFSLMDRYR